MTGGQESSTSTSAVSSNGQGDLKKMVWLGLLAVVMFRTVSFDSTTISLYKHSISTDSIFQQGDDSEGSNLSVMNAARSHNTNKDWQAELFALTTGGSFEKCPAGLALHGDPFQRHNNITQDCNMIPRIIHIRTPSQCLSSPTRQQVQAWKHALGKKHSYQVAIHDDNAEERLLFERYWKQFPQLQQMMLCASAETRREIWKALVLYRYGGIIVDLDQLQPLNDNTTVQESFLQILENSTAPALMLLDKSQHLTTGWLASPPRHAFHYLWVHTLMVGLMTMRGVDDQWGAGKQNLHKALAHFRKHMHRVNNITAYEIKPDVYVQPEAHHARVRVMDAASLSWFQMAPPVANSPPRAEAVWGNTDTCLMRIYRVHESSHPPPPHVPRPTKRYESSPYEKT